MCADARSSASSGGPGGEDLEPFLAQKAGQDLALRLFVVDDQDDPLAHRPPPAPSSGSRTIILVPSPGRDSTSRVPPWAVTIW